MNEKLEALLQQWEDEVNMLWKFADAQEHYGRTTSEGAAAENEAKQLIARIAQVREALR